MTGWRLGYLAAPEPIAKAIDAIQSHSTSNPNSFAQKGGVAALTGPQDHLATGKTAGTFPIPIALVPGHLSDEDIDASS